jgi:AcrR family transcriptional regulator
MSGEVRERADAARNRRAILAATEQLLAARPPQEISMEMIAAAAGVGKGTIFHRFGSRMGLMVELMTDRARALEGAVAGGPPPLGPGAPDRDRLLAFLDAVVDVVARNKHLMAELAFPATAHQARPDRDQHPVYRFWHGHVSGLIAAQKPDADAEMLAHLLLGSLHSELVVAQLTDREQARLTAALHTLACAVLDAPAP